MEKRNLGKDFTVSAVVMGCMGLSHAYGAPTEKNEAIRLLHQAVDLGYTFFDTAEVYGTADDPHINEEIVGEALRPYKDKVVIATKFGIRFDKECGTYPYPLIADAHPESIRKSVEGSLKRLGIECIDLYYQHRIDPNIPPEDVAGVMSELIKEGKIKRWGISETGEEYLRRAHAVCPVTAVENRYSMMYRDYESLFPTLEELGIAFVAFSPMANGFLTAKYDETSRFEKGTDYRNSMPQFQSDAIKKNQELLDLLRKTAAEKNATPAQISLAWMMCKKPYIIPIPGTRKLERLCENAGASDIRLSEQEVIELDAALDKLPMSDVFGGSKTRTINHNG
ncbi:MAG: aldo/keto reductase [Clostridiales bacterium]|nr:aldo/keto reductase [Clostridiales bacterium]